MKTASKPIGDSTGYLPWVANAPAGTYQAVGYPVEHNGRLVSDGGFMAIGTHDIFDISRIYNAPGSSGGPILDAGNRVVGVISSYNWAARIDREADSLAAWIRDNDSIIDNSKALVADGKLFDPWSYMALNPDVFAAFGTDLQALANHYATAGRNEGRQASGFDPWSYAAANPDVFAAFGTDTQALTTHYITVGRNEGRAQIAFDPWSYAASNPDVFTAFGTDTRALTAHYQSNGRAEGRSIGAFDPEAYAALNSDLFAAFGLDSQRLINHYITFGRNEGRQTMGFDPVGYAATNPDVLAAHGTDAGALVGHYVTFGRNEGRQTMGFDPVGYAATNPDVLAAHGTDAGALVGHYVTFGRKEGRSTGYEWPAASTGTAAASRLPDGDESAILAAFQPSGTDLTLTALVPLAFEAPWPVAGMDVVVEPLTLAAWSPAGGPTPYGWSAATGSIQPMVGTTPVVLAGSLA